MRLIVLLLLGTFAWAFPPVQHCVPAGTLGIMVCTPEPEFPDPEQRARTELTDHWKTLQKSLKEFADRYGQTQGHEMLSKEKKAVEKAARDLFESEWWKEPKK